MRLSRWVHTKKEAVRLKGEFTRIGLTDVRITGTQGGPYRVIGRGSVTVAARFICVEAHRESEKAP